MRGSRRPPFLGRVALAFALATAALALAPAVAAAAGTLGPGGTLTAGQVLTSPDGHYDLVMQSDGNLVLYLETGRALWSTKTAGNPGDHAVMQTNGNLTVYDAGGNALWSTNTAGDNCAYLTVQNDGNVVLYGSSGAVWATGTVNSVLQPGDELTAGQELYSNSEQFRLIMQGDGNLVLYDGAGRALWATATEGQGGVRAVMQGDGNFVVYTAAGAPVWNSVTEGKPGGRLVVQDDGNVVIYVGSTAVWASGTAGASFRRATVRAAAIPHATPPGNCGVPLPPPPTPPQPIVVYVPVIVRVPVPRAPHHVKVRVAMSWTWNGDHTRLYAVDAKHVPRRAGVTVTCRGRGCPARAQVASAHVKRLLSSLAGQTYRAGDRLFITIRSPGQVPERIEVVIRSGREPTARLV